MSAKSNWLNLPNALTLSRVALGAVALAPLTADKTALLPIVFAFMLAAELTDFLDGWAARATGQVSEAGKILDPMADSMYRLMIFAGFVELGWMPAWMLVIFILRDVGVAYTRIFASRSGRPVASRFSGKAKAVAQAAAQLFAVGVPAFGLIDLQPYVWPLLLLAAAVTLYSFADYVFGMLRTERVG